MMVSITQHHKNVRLLPCVLSRQAGVTLHHVHGGSCIEAWGSGMRGTSQKTSDYLVVPITARYHFGAFGIDGSIGVREWEKRFGTQVWMLNEVNNMLTYDIFDLAGVPAPGEFGRFQANPISVLE